MADANSGIKKYYSREAMDRIVETAGGFPKQARNKKGLRCEIEQALEFAATGFVDRFIGKLVLSSEGHQPPKPRRRGPRPEVELQQFIEACQGIWLSVFNKRFQTSRDLYGEGSGPQVRFVVACCRELHDALANPELPAVLYSSGGKTRPSEREELTDRLSRLTNSSIEARLRKTSSWPGTIARLKASIESE
jgi:hypothetical protein